MPPKNPWVLPDGFDENVKKALAEIQAAFKRAKKAIPKEALDALRMGNWQAFLAIIDREDLAANFAGLESILRSTAKASAVSLYEKGGVGAKLTFDLIDEYSVNFASTRTGLLIKDISEEMRLTIERTITEATLGDITWQTAAEQIAEYIPLTQRDAGAVRKYHDRMLKKYIDRKGWNEKSARKYAKTLADKYAQKLTDSRARTIARTEIANAATEGQYIGWESGVQTGMIDAESTKEWIAEPNACEYCAAIDGQTVRWDEEFPILGGKMMPPAHPNCRCATALLPPDYGIPELQYTPFTLQAMQKSKGWWNQFEIEFAKHLAGKHDQSSHGHGNGAALKMPEGTGLISESHVANKFPFVGLSDKAKEIRSRITLDGTEEQADVLGRRITVSNARYTTESGQTIYLEHKQMFDEKGTTLDGRITASIEDEGTFPIATVTIGHLSHASLSDNFIYEADRKDFKYNRISSIGVNPDLQRQGIATAMLEFGRMTSPNPVFHSGQRTDEGEAFSAATKSALAKAIIDYQAAEKLAKAELYKPTQGMVAAAKRALRWKEEGKATGAGTPVGWGRATDIAAGRSMSLSIVKRMYSFFSRHEVDKKGKDFDNLSNPSNGRIMWDAWGGDAGFTWSKAIVERAKKLEKHLQGQHDQSTHGRGGHSTDRPYELKSKRNNPDYFGGEAWQANAAEGKGPNAYILAQYGNSYGEKAKAQFMYELAVRAKIEQGADKANVRASILTEIKNDPDYPKIPQEIFDQIDDRPFYGRSDEYKAMQKWAEIDPEAATAYMARENAFVESKLRAATFPNGQTVGEITDGVAQSLLDQMQEIALGNNVSLTMSAGRLKKFIEEDHYRTAFETTLSGKGASRQAYLDARDTFELNKMGIPTMTKDSERPIYGVIGRSSGESTYGDTQIIFKDDVKHRTTATIGDSLDAGHMGVHWLQDYADGKVSIDDLFETHGRMFLGVLGNNNRSGSTFEWKLEPSGRAEWGGIKGYSGKADIREMAEYGYIETQIHGGLKLSDVATIVIPSPTSIPKATQAMLADKGIEVIVGSHIEKSGHA